MPSAAARWDEVRALYPSPDTQIDGMTSASDALKMAEETEYDVALLDIDMPDMDGLSLARRLIASCPVINIIRDVPEPAGAFRARAG